MKKHLELNRYRPDIDGLRGIAVAAVILFHLNKNWLPGGFTGVDIFFVISGYVVTSSILNHESKSISDYFLGFYARRVKRIFPALIACTIGSVLLTVLLVPSSQTLVLIRSAIWGLFGWSNNFFIRTSLDYFKTDETLNPFLHTWSLGVEEQFYFVFPILLFIIYGLKRPINKNSNIKFWLLIITICVSAAISMWLSFTNQTWAYYFMPSRFWEMGAGALLFILVSQEFDLKFNSHPLFYPSLQLGSVLLIGTSLLMTDVKNGFPFPSALPAVLGSLMFILSGVRKNSLINNLISSPLFLYIGKTSYSLYLWHWPIITLFLWTVGLDSILNMVIALIIIFCLSSLSYFFIETPIKKIKIKNRKILSIGLGTLVLASAAIFNINQNKSLSEKFTLRKYPNDSKSYLAYLGDNWKDPNLSLMEGYPQITSGNCMSPAGIQYSLSKIKLDLCVTQPISSQTQTIFLIGDSHAFHLFPMFKEIIKKNPQIGLLTTWKWNCIISDSLDLGSKQNRGYCKEFATGEISKAIKLLKAGDIVVISTWLNSQITEVSADIDRQKSIDRMNNMVLEGIKVDRSTKLREYSKSLTRITKKFSEIGVKTILWVDTPELKRNPLICSNIFSLEIPKTNCSPDKQILDRMQKTILEVFINVKNSNPNVYIFNPNEILAPNGKFLFVDDDGLFLMSDTHHLSSAAGRKLATPFYQFLLNNHLLNH